MKVIAPSRLSRYAAHAIALVVVATTGFMLLRYPALPDILPVHFGPGGIPDGWQFKTVPRVLMPTLIQAALALSLGAIAALLLSRGNEHHEPDAPDVRAAAAAAETVLLIALIWVAFQAYAAFALVRVWTTSKGHLGALYVPLQLAGLVLTGVAAVRGHVRVGKPTPRPFVPAHWRFRQLYKNPGDPALFVPTRDGSRWTLNFGRPVAAALLGAILVLGVVAPTLILILSLRVNF